MQDSLKPLNKCEKILGVCFMSHGVLIIFYQKNLIKSFDSLLGLEKSTFFCSLPKKFVATLSFDVWGRNNESYPKFFHRMQDFCLILNLLEGFSSNI